MYLERELNALYYSSVMEGTQLVLIYCNVYFCTYELLLLEVGHYLAIHYSMRTITPT